MSVNFYKLMRRLQWGTHLGLAGGKRVKNKLTDILLMNKDDKKPIDPTGDEPQEELNDALSPIYDQLEEHSYWRAMELIPSMFPSSLESFTPITSLHDA